MTIPFMAIYFSQHLNANPIEIGLILGGGLLTSCISGLFIGGLVDRFNAKIIAMIGTGGSAIIFFIFAAPLSLLDYGILNLLLGILRASIDTSTQSYIMELLPEEKRSLSLNLRYTVINISATVGPLIGAFLINRSAHFLFIIAAIIYAISVLLISILPKSNLPCSTENIWHSLQASTKILWQENTAKIIFLIEACYCIGFAQIETTLPQIMGLRLNHDYIYSYSWVLITNAIIVVISQLWINRLMQACSAQQAALLLFGLFSLAFLSFAFSHTVFIFICAMIIFSLGEVVGVGLYNKIIDQASTENNRGAYFGVLSFALIGFPVGTSFGGILLKYFGGAALFICIAFIGVIIGYYLTHYTKAD